MQTSGSFRKVNPTLETLVTTLHAMVDTLQRAKPDWWKEGGDAPLENNDDEASVDVQQQESSEEDEDSDATSTASISMHSEDGFQECRI